MWLNRILGFSNFEWTPFCDIDIDDDDVDDDDTDDDIDRDNWDDDDEEDNDIDAGVLPHWTKNSIACKKSESLNS